MAEVTRKVMTYGIFLHFAFAFYMYSNSQIFTYSGSFAWLDEAKSSTEGIGIDSVLGQNNYISSKRISQTHAYLYLIGFGLFIALYILTSIMTSICPEQTCLRMFCCYSSERLSGQKTLRMISRNIYKELSIEDLRSEYIRTVLEIEEYE